MAKGDGQTGIFDVSEVLNSMPKLPAVYDAKEFTNRAFTLNSVEWRDFPANQRNNYNATRKLIMNCVELSTGKEVVLETTQRGIVEPVKQLSEAGYIPCNLMIVKEGKFCSITAR